MQRGDAERPLKFLRRTTWNRGGGVWGAIGDMKLRGLLAVVSCGVGTPPSE